MSDLIRREDAIDAALTFLVEYCGAEFDEDMQKMLCDRIKDLPSAEPKWLKISPAGIYECSECHQNVMTGDIEEYHFCHHCGARMDAERNEE